MVMASRWLMAAAAALLLASPLRADLTTETFNDVKDEVQARADALVGDLDKAEKKQLKACKRVLNAFTKKSKSTKQDAARIQRIVGMLLKSFPGDEDMAELLAKGLGGFQHELTAPLTEFHKAGMGVSVLDDDNKRKKSADKTWAKASDLDEAADAELDLKVRARLIRKLLGASVRSWKAAVRALARQELVAHEQAFLFDLADGYSDADTCMSCHTDEGAEIMASGHWNWQGVATNIEGYETTVVGKQDLINNFCIATPSNEGRCTQCHVGMGWKDASFDFTDTSAMDCLVCHDSTGLYKKGKTTAGVPAPDVDLHRVALHAGEPTRNNCGSCHFYAGGGDNVKHGDLSSDLIAPTRSMDVHMGVDGGNLSCQSCHVTTDHEIAGMPLHSTGAGPVDCTTCHAPAELPGFSHEVHHLDNVACQTCHIPAFSRSMPTKVSWLWADAGQTIDPIPLDKYGKPTYDKKKGTFIWQQEVKPTLRWSNGKWRRMILNENDQYDTLPVVFAEPVGEKHVGAAKISPFKKMVGNQPADAVNKTMLVPHLFGLAGGANPYWAKYNWYLALQEGAAYAGQTFSGDYEFVDTEMYLSVNHEIAPKEQALSCNDCHNGGIDFTELGYSGDPTSGGT
jgi:octaheme c-type cytochrome (tetrathionate reductase family)